MEVLREWLTSQGLEGPYVSIAAAFAAGLAVVILSILANVVARGVIVRAVHRFIASTQTTWDDAFMDRRVFTRLSHLAPVLIIHISAPLALADYPTLIAVVRTVAFAYMVVVGLSVADGFLSACMDIYQMYPVSRRVHVRGFVQVLKIILYGCGVVLILSHLLGRSPIVFFSGLGAFTAVLLLIFKDSILGLMAGIQLMSNNMVRRGDWIEMPRYGADGDVIDVSMMTVKVQNWDKTISTIPTYALISDSFKNWRGMSESGGRRIKRAVHIDMTSVKFCDQEMLDRFKKFQYIREHVERKIEEIARHNAEHEVDERWLVNGRHLTNIGIFRAYLEAYLRRHPKIHQELTFLVRQLAPTEHGLPIEIYVFSNVQAWASYEAIQADIFDHILAVLPLFDLRVFQTPAGTDLQALASVAGRAIPQSVG